MSSFQPDCALPSTTTRYVSSPNVRGTLDIVWSCLGILILCLWNVIHINVRAPLYPSKAWSKQWLFNRARTVVLKIQWMGIAFLAPEILVAKALHDKLIVNESIKVMKKLAETDGVRWTALHAHFANMGAFVLHFTSSTLSSQPSKPVTETPRKDGSPEQSRLPNTVFQAELNSSIELREFESTTSHSPTKGEVVRDAEIQQEKNAHPIAKEHSVVKNTSEILSKESDPSVSLCQPKLIDAFGQDLKTVPARYGQEIWERDATNLARTGEALDILKTSEVFSIRFRNRQRNALALQGDLWVLDAAQMHVARSFGGGENPLFRLPDIHEEHLESESKSDPLLKVLTIIQVAWMAIQLLVRLYRHLPTSQLEIMTFAYAICSIITYIALLEKPKDVVLTKTIQALRYPTATELLDIALAGPSTIFRYRTGYWIPNNIVHHLGNSHAMTAIASENLKMQQKIERLDAAASYSRIIFIVTGCIGATLFGSLHFISWDFQFPTPIERLLWRIAICVTVGLPLLGATAQSLFALCFQLRTKRGRKENKSSTKNKPTQRGHLPLEQYQRTYLRVTTWLLSIIGLFYILVRLFVMIEVFRSLAFLAPDAYRTSWAVSIPHIG